MRASAARRWWLAGVALVACALERRAVQLPDLRMEPCEGCPCCCARLDMRRGEGGAGNEPGDLPAENAVLCEGDADAGAIGCMQDPFGHPCEGIQ